MEPTKVILDYYDRLDICSALSTIVRTEEITVQSDMDSFEQMYKKNNSLRYCNGAYYKFTDKLRQVKYEDWLKSDDFKKKSFNLYYGNGVVD